MNQSPGRAPIVTIFFLFLVSFRASAADAPAIATFDFRDAVTVDRWRAANDVGVVRATAEGMEVVASGDDPFLEGPSVELPAGEALALELKVRSERGGEVEVFYFTEHARAGQSVSARVAPGMWETLRLPLPPLGKRVKFRIDPPAKKGGGATIASMAVRRRVVVKEPAWPTSPAGPAGEARGVVRSGELTLTHTGAPAAVEVRVGGRLMARGLSRSLIGYAVDEQ